MYELLGCPHCHRHARAGETACPFCGGTLEGARPGEVRGVSRRELTRGAIVMSAAALVGCGATSEEREDETAGGGDDTSGGDTGGGGPRERRDPEEYRHHDCDPNDMSCMAMPYGAPALPESIV